jgi:monofunctional biosynthetic peptidoglycan transglycosylase
MTRRRVLGWRPFATSATVAITAGAVGAIWLYVALPVAALRETLAYRPAGAATSRVTGLHADGIVELDAIPEHLLVALLFNEDKKFFDHHGFDFQEMIVSLREWATGARRLRGASTLTQQLARSIFLSPDRRLGRKIGEALYTVQLERSFTKDEILVLYVNTVEWGPSVYGIAEAAAHYFRRAPHELEPAESAFLVAILPNPARLADAFAKRRGTPLRVQRVLAALALAERPRAAGSDDASEDPLVRLVPAVIQARERATARRPAS